MRVSEVMTRDVASIAADDSIAAAAQRMMDLDVGAIPVAEGKKVTGILTDRDIVIRAVARGLDAAATPVREIMSTDLFVCRPEDSLEEVSEQMGLRQVRRIPVVDDDGTMVGIVSLGDVAKTAGLMTGGETLVEVSEGDKGGKLPRA